MPAEAVNIDDLLHFKDLHPDWCGAIGQSIETDALKDFVFNDRRIDRQQLKRLFSRYEIADVTHVELKHIDFHAIEALINDREQFLLVTGMVWYANYLSSLIAPGQLSEMLNGLRLDLVKKAVRKRGIAPEINAQNFDPERAEASMIETGTRVVIAWSRCLPSEVCGRIGLLFARSLVAADQNYDLESVYAAPIVRIVPEILVNSQKSLPRGERSA